MNLGHMPFGLGTAMVAFAKLRPCESNKNLDSVRILSSADSMQSLSKADSVQKSI